MRTARMSAVPFFCFVLAGCLFAASGRGAPGGAGRTWVVDGGHPQADDAGPGTEDRPWKTIGQAARKAGAGDTVCVMEGNYPEKVVVPASASGQEAGKTVFRAYPRHSVQVQGFDLDRAGDVRIEGFRLVGSGVLGTWKDGVEVGDNQFEVKTYGAYAGDASPRKCLIAGNRLVQPQSGFVISGRDWIVERNEIDRLRQYERRDSDYSRAFGDGHVIRRNYYHGARLEDIGTAHVDGCQTWHLKAQPDSHLRCVTFEDNVFLNIGQGIIARNEEEANHLGGFTCRRNIFGLGMGGGADAGRGAWGSCLQNVYGLTAENNLVLRCIHGIGIWGSGELVARNNIVWETGTSIWAAGAERGETPFGGRFTARHNLVTSTRSKLDDTNLVKDPMFVDAAAGNFRLRKGSPAIGAGEGNVTIGPLEYPNVYYVDPGHPAADDAKFGYAAVPFKTASRACEVAETGETVVLCGGVYRETIVVKKDGITIRAAKGERVVVSGADLIVGWKRDGEKWTAPLEESPRRLKASGWTLPGLVGSWKEFTYDSATKRVVVRGGDPRLQTVETVVREHGFDLTGRKGVKIEDIEVVDTRGEATTGAAK